MIDVTVENWLNSFRLNKLLKFDSFIVVGFLFFKKRNNLIALDHFRVSQFHRLEVYVFRGRIAHQFIHVRPWLKWFCFCRSFGLFRLLTLSLARRAQSHYLLLSLSLSDPLCMHGLCVYVATGDERETYKTNDKPCQCVSFEHFPRRTGRTKTKIRIETSRITEINRLLYAHTVL